jgi:hypothetical protein
MNTDHVRCASAAPPASGATRRAGAAQLVNTGDIDYLVFDYLAEITMSLLARAAPKSPQAGYAPDFVRSDRRARSPNTAQGIAGVSNAGG